MLEGRVLKEREGEGSANSRLAGGKARHGWEQGTPFGGELGYQMKLGVHRTQKAADK